MVIGKIFSTVVCVCFSVCLCAQTYSSKDLEAHFLKENLLLIAGKLEIDKADALTVQEKLWSNPTLTVSEFNLWKTYDIEEQPLLFGNYGRNQQIAVELEQLIETAGKRKKRVVIKELEKNNALHTYEELMRDLKKELRQSLHTLARIQKEEIQLHHIVHLFERLENQYAQQAQKQNIAKADHYRVQTELISLKKEWIELVADREAELHKVRVLTHLPNLTIEQVSFDKENYSLTSALPINLTAVALDNNIELQRQANEVLLSEKQLVLERAERTPDLTVGINYDRGGNIMKDFIGIGVSVDLPMWNRNKGNIRAAEYTIEQEKRRTAALQWELENTVIRLRSKMQQYEQSLQQWGGQHQQDHLQVLESYQKQLHNRQVTLLEFIDFTQALRSSQSAYQSLKEEYLQTYEEIQYVVGKDF